MYPSSCNQGNVHMIMMWYSMNSDRGIVHVTCVFLSLHIIWIMKPLFFDLFACIIKIVI